MSITRGLAGFHDKARLVADCLRALERRGVATEPLERTLLALCDDALEAWFWHDEREIERLAGRLDDTAREILRRLAGSGRARPEPQRSADAPARSEPCGVPAAFTAVRSTAPAAAAVRPPAPATTVRGGSGAGAGRPAGARAPREAA